MTRLEELAQIITRRAHVLLVDDDEILCRSLELAFESDEQVKLTATTRGERAITMLNDGKFDCVILDFRFPSGQMNGVQIFKTIRQTHKRLPVFFLTGYSDRLDSHEIDGAIIKTKPPELDDLRDSILQSIHGYRAYEPA